ncbi:UNVERIFIED_CONTAM: hypothetical protein HDU68_000828, partial [Siphonaria sp. JEL0065]
IETKLNFNDPRDLSTRSQMAPSSRSCMVKVAEDEDASDSGIRWKGKGRSVDSIHRDIHDAGMEVHEAMGKVMKRGGDLRDMRSSAGLFQYSFSQKGLNAVVQIV